jgi:restriction system protein
VVSLLSRAVVGLLFGFGLLVAGAWLLAEAHPLWFWLSAGLFAAYVAWAVVLERRRLDAIRRDAHVPSMSPVEYEHFVARLLNDAGWNVRHIGALGDQGVDVIAEIRGVMVAVQAKKYSGRAGNDAVQQVVAGKRYHGCAVAAVVAPNSYTRAAKQLADANGVLLLHHDDLPRLEKLARVP